MTPKSNVLLIFADELRADALGCFGNPIIKTPNLDRLASGGTRFSQCMISQPTCTPCRASLLSGCFPSALRSRMVGCQTPDDPRLLPHVLADAGYHTASIGKIHLQPQAWEPDAVLATQQQDGSFDYYGFQHVDLVNGHGDHCFGPDYTPWLHEQVPSLKDGKPSHETLCAISNCYRWPLPPHVHSSEYISTRAVEFLQRAKTQDKPFFLHCSFPDPHHPFTVPEPYASRYAPEDMPAPLPPISKSMNPPKMGLDAYYARNYEMYKPNGDPGDRVIGTPPYPYSQYILSDWQTIRAVTAGMISLLDDSIGRILDALDSTGLAENTIVVFASDHGDYLGDYGLFGKGLHYNCVLRSPLILRGPGIPENRCEDRMTSFVDVAPTLLDFLGIDEPEAIQGLSLKAGLANEDAWPRDATLSENDDDMGKMRLRTLTTADWKLSVYAGSEFGELYDRRTDPDEQNNLWYDPAHAGTRARLMGSLTDHLLCAIDGANGRIQKPAPEITKHIPLKTDGR